MNAIAKYTNLYSDGSTRSHQYGAIADDDGVIFRLSAPQADRVYLLGEFNGWDEARTPLKDMGEGIWQVRVESAEVGDEYLFVYYAGAKRTELIDPAAETLSPDRQMAVVD